MYIRTDVPELPGLFPKPYLSFPFPTHFPSLSSEKRREKNEFEAERKPGPLFFLFFDELEETQAKY